MKSIIKSILMEAPLPDDWDPQVYTPKTSFAAKIKYATERAAKIGSGSSRVAFVIDYQGRKTVLKIAKNAKGVAQNVEEINVLNDYILKETGLFIPMIDSDDENGNHPQWIHTEFAEKCTASDFKKACGGSPADLVAYANYFMGNKHEILSGDWRVIDRESKLAVAFVEEYAAQFMPMLDDYKGLANWGMYKGSPVILDAGLSEDVYTTHYS